VLIHVQRYCIINKPDLALEWIKRSVIAAVARINSILL